MKKLKVWAITNKKQDTVAVSSGLLLVFESKRAARYGLSQMNSSIPLIVVPSIVIVEQPKRKQKT
jgi:hypothetical protein